MVHRDSLERDPGAKRWVDGPVEAEQYSLRRRVERTIVYCLKLMQRSLEDKERLKSRRVHMVQVVSKAIMHVLALVPQVQHLVANVNEANALGEQR